MSFVNPIFFWAMFAIAIPIIIHLINFRRHKTLYFSNTSFLQDIKKETQTRTKLKQILILLARIFAISMLVVAFAGPFLPSNNSDAQSKTHINIIYIDNSFSMENEGKSGVVFEQARQIAKQIVFNSGAGKEFILITNDMFPEHQFVLDRDKFIQEVDKIEISPSLKSLDELVLKANTETFGNPEITNVKIGVGKNPGILISGHDLKDLEQLLIQTEGKGIDIYTHSEMLPANAYPNLKKYKHLVGNYGNAWHRQLEEFETFNGPILFTTNCLVPPRKATTYNNRVFTTGATGMPEWKRIEKKLPNGHKDFSEIIELAKTCPPPTEIETGEITIGFAHNQVLALADKVLDAVNSGAIKKLVVMSGCDARQKTREYYTEFAKQLPKDTVILTSGCAKYRYNKLKLGDIGGIPRVLDAGQCNDSYSWAFVALKLKEVLKLDDINKLPIVFNIAWYEQKAIIVHLALLYLGIKNTHVGPTLPGFLTPNLLKAVQESFGVQTIKTVEEDMKIFELA